MTQWIISSCVLLLVVIALRYLLRGKISLRMQYALWLLVLVRLLVPLSFGASGLSVMNAVPEYAPQQNTLGLPDTANVPGAAGTPAQDAGEPLPPDLAQNFTTVTSEPTVKTTDWASIAKAVWLIGAGLVGTAFLLSNLRFGARLRRSRRRVDAVDAMLPVYESGAAVTPCLFGLLHPSIYLTPETLMDAPALRYSLAHEQTHYRHGDSIWAVLRGVCLALHWYNPLVWWAAELSRRDAELACDEATIRRLGEGERAAYGRTLLRMTCEKRPALLVTATMMTDSGKGLRERITLLVKKPKTAAYTALALLLIACLSVACTFTGKQTELTDPFGKEYEVAEVVYQPSVYSFTLTSEDAPGFRIAPDGKALTVVDRSGDGAESAYGPLEAYTLTKESFDERFLDVQRGWAGGTSRAAKLRRGNAKAWHCTAAEDPAWPEEIYLLQQKDGTLYLIMGYDWATSENFPDGMHSFRWLFRLSEIAASGEDDASLDMPPDRIADYFGDGAAAQRYDGDGWYLYIPDTAWKKTSGEDSWYAADDEASTLRVDKSYDSVQMMEDFYRDAGFTLEQYRADAALSGPWLRYDAWTDTQFANYLAANGEEGGAYIISIAWQPDGDPREEDILRAMAQSFTLAPGLKSRTEEPEDETAQEPPTEIENAEEEQAAEKAPDELRADIRRTAQKTLERDGALWYVADGALRRCDARGSIEQIYKLPNSEVSPVILEKLDNYGGMVWLAYRVGGGFMGSTRHCLFDSETGKLAYDLADCAMFLIDGNTVVKTSSFSAPTPNNLSISRDRGETWASLGDPKYIYNRGYTTTDENGGWTYYTVSDTFRLEGGYLYTEGVDTSTWSEEGQPMGMVSLRVDLATGETVVLSAAP